MTCTEQTNVASNWRRGLPLDKPYLIPDGWEKGEPLMVECLGETCYRLYRSGSYLQLPGAPVSPHSVVFLEFNSRAEMVEFQEWWGKTTHPDKRRPHFYLTPQEFVEINQELFHLNLREILGNRQGVNEVPNFTMSLVVDDEDTVQKLEAAHYLFILKIQRILGVLE